MFYSYSLFCWGFFNCCSPLTLSLTVSAHLPPTLPFACAGANPGWCSKSFSHFLHHTRDQRLTPERQPYKHWLWVNGEEFGAP